MSMNEIQQHLQQQVRASGLSFRRWYQKRYLNSSHWKELRKKKYSEVGRKCECCGYTKTLQVHHVNYRDIYDVETSDLKVLCDLCHRTEHNRHNKRAMAKIEAARAKRGIKTPKPQKKTKKQRHKKLSRRMRRAIERRAALNDNSPEMEVVRAMKDALSKSNPR